MSPTRKYKRKMLLDLLKKKKNQTIKRKRHTFRSQEFQEVISRPYRLQGYPYKKRNKKKVNTRS
jgi:hypothetical protein